MYIEPSEWTDATKLSFEVKVLEFSSNRLSMQLKFENPAYVSTTNDKDVLVLRMDNFRDPDGKLIADEFLLRKNLPNQMDADYAVKIEQASQAAGGLIGAGFSFTAIVNLVVGSRMNEMLGSVKNLQLIVHLTLMHVMVPANAQVLFSAIFEYVTFDLFDTSALTGSYY